MRCHMMASSSGGSLSSGMSFPTSLVIEASEEPVEGSKRPQRAVQRPGKAASELRPPDQVPMDISDEVEDEALVNLNEDELRVLQKVDSIQVIEGMRISPVDASRFHIPLCRMVYMPLVRPTLAYDIKKLEAEFTHGYRPGAPVFYVSIYNEHGEERLVTEEDTSTWGPHWNAANTEFEAKLASSPHLNFLSGRMFFICDGNHRYKAWTGCIKRLHSTERKWHYAVDNICLDTRGKEGQLLNAMHDINKSTEHSHVKTNIVHILHRVKAVGSQPLESFKDMLTPDEYLRCQSNPQLGKTWFKLTTDVFISFLFRQEIAEASDDAARKYYEETEEKDKTCSGVTFAMRAAARVKQHSFKGEFSKFTAVANPKLGDEFMHKVTKHWSNNEKPEMTLDKLQMIATAAAAPDQKVRWLQQWNSSSMTREVVHFPAKGFTEKDFEAWLNRASFWAGLEDAAVAMYSKTVDEDGLEIRTSYSLK